jgi:hypothetical protein
MEGAARGTTHFGVLGREGLLEGAGEFTSTGLSKVFDDERDRR